MRDATDGHIGSKNHGIIAAINRRNIIIIFGLTGELGNGHFFALTKTAHFVYLPVIIGVIILLDRRADDHRKKRFGAAPMHAWLSHCYCIPALFNACIAVSCLASEIAECAVRVAYHQVAAAGCVIDPGIVIAEGLRDGSKSIHRCLRNKEDGIGRRHRLRERARAGTKESYAEEVELLHELPCVIG